MATSRSAARSRKADDQPPPATQVDDAPWVARRAFLELQMSLQKLTATQRMHSASAMADYHREILRILQDSSEKETAALDAIQAQAQRTSASLEDRLDADRKIQVDLASDRQVSDDAYRAASRSLSETLYRARLDALDDYHAAQVRYREGAREPLAGAASPASWSAAFSPFAVAGDEGAAFAAPDELGGFDTWTAAGYGAY